MYDISNAHPVNERDDDYSSPTEEVLYSVD